MSNLQQEIARQEKRLRDLKAKERALKAKARARREKELGRVVRVALDKGDRAHFDGVIAELWADAHPVDAGAAPPAPEDNHHEEW